MAVAKKKPEFVPDDETLEFAAQLIEEPSFTDMRGTLTRRKRDRAKALERQQAREECRREMAEHLRAFKARRDLDATAILARIAEEIELGRDAVIRLVDAWPLAWKGWLNIEARIRCNSNSIPPETHYHIELTDEGREVLKRRPASDQSQGGSDAG